jgi:hypothetical protein
MSSGQYFVLALVLGPSFVWLANNWIRARHGYAIEDDEGNQIERADTRQLIDLKAENTELRAHLAKVNNRLLVLERIATDGSVGVAAQIEPLRDAPRADALLDARQKAGEV